MRNATIIALTLALFVLACGAPRTIVTPAPRPTRTPAPTAAPTKVPLSIVRHVDFGDDWPLLVEEGTIICSGTVILLRTNRGLFAVNGTARGQKRWKDIFDIVKPGMSVQPIINRGLGLCK